MFNVIPLLNLKRTKSIILILVNLAKVVIWKRQNVKSFENAQLSSQEVKAPMSDIGSELTG